MDITQQASLLTIVQLMVDCSLTPLSSVHRCVRQQLPPDMRSLPFIPLDPVLCGQSHDPLSVQLSLHAALYAAALLLIAILRCCLL